MRNRQTLLRVLVASCALVLGVVLTLGAATAQPTVAGPRNIIVMIGDGRGFNHVAATDLYQAGKLGAQVYESFPVQLACSTYSLSTKAATGMGYSPAATWADFDVAFGTPTDSAAAGTALATGRKTFNGGISVVPAKGKGNLDGAKRAPTFMERAERRGKSTGVVTTVELADATPAVHAAHVTDRHDWTEISRQMIEDSRMDVVMGCGHPLYTATGEPVPAKSLTEDAYHCAGGKAVWQKLLAGKAGGDADGDGKPDPWKFIDGRDDFQRLAAGALPKRVFGIARSAAATQQTRAGDANADPFVVPKRQDVPTLSEMALGALNVLSQDPDGFVVMIEGGAIDDAAHVHRLGRMIEETIEFGEAVGAVVGWIEAHGGWQENLLVVTADHETGYLTGPGSGNVEGGAPVWNPLVSNGQGHVPGIEWHSGGHSNNLVPLAARGAGSERLSEAATRTDPRRGPYLDNTDIGRIIFEFLG
jgi:alkaline phosphatase